MMHPFLPAVTLVIGWVVGFLCCWKMQKDHKLMECKHCHVGQLSLCDCGCAANGNSMYECSNIFCDGTEFQILGCQE